MKKFANIVIMGTTVFPACIVLWYQSNILFETSASGGESGIAIMFAEWFLGGSFKDVILKFFCGCSFPLIVMIHERKRMTKKDNFIYLMFLVTLCQVSMLGETGRRATHYNFYWGLYNSAYLLFAFAISKFCDVWRGERKEIFYKVVGIVLLGAHLISGITYFLYVYSGFTPWNM